MSKWITTKSGKRIKVQKKSDWISVKDRLPERDTVVLAYSINGRMYTVGYIDKLVGFMTRDTVTHWMPLPEPPKERCIMTIDELRCQRWLNTTENKSIKYTVISE